MRPEEVWVLPTGPLPLRTIHPGGLRVGSRECSDSSSNRDVRLISGGPLNVVVTRMRGLTWERPQYTVARSAGPPGAGFLLDERQETPESGIHACPPESMCREGVWALPATVRPPCQGEKLAGRVSRCARATIKGTQEIPGKPRCQLVSGFEGAAGILAFAPPVSRHGADSLVGGPAEICVPYTRGTTSARYRGSSRSP